MQEKFFALTAQVEALKRENGGGTKTEGSKEVSWRYLNLENNTDLTRGDRKYKLCTKIAIKTNMARLSKLLIKRRVYGREES